MIVNAVKLLPLPDSPTMQVVLPAYNAKVALLTSNRDGALRGKTVKSLTFKIGEISWGTVFMVD